MSRQGTGTEDRADEMNWRSMAEVLALVAERPKLGRYMVSVVDRIGELGAEAAAEAERCYPQAWELCTKVESLCAWFTRRVTKASGAAMPIRLAGEDEASVREAIRMFPPASHLMANVLGSAESLAVTAQAVVPPSCPLLRRRLRSVIDATREAHTQIGL